MNGREVANAYTELNDPVTQAECFAQQAKVALPLWLSAICLCKDVCLSFDRPEQQFLSGRAQDSQLQRRGSGPVLSSPSMVLQTLLCTCQLP